MKTLTLSLSAARSLMLAAQGLLDAPERPAQKADLLAAIRRMGALQIDTIHVVARSPYFVLWSRIGGYDPRWLDELLAEGQVFEYWAHAACFLPVEEYPFFRRRMEAPPSDWRAPHAWLAEHADLVERVLARIRAEGPVKSADFENPRAAPGGWWNWKEEKQALEHLLTAGVLMIARRENFQRVYDLTERVLPQAREMQIPSEEEAARHLVLKTVQALGLAFPAWIPDYYRLSRIQAANAVEELLRAGELVAVAVEGFEGPAYILAEHAERAGAAADGALIPRRTTLLSPFDPLVWDRARARQLFGFDYSIECYLPEGKRRYGYFSLPVLHRGELIGRLDAKAHRKEGCFEVRGLWLEPGVSITAEAWDGLAGAITECAAWHGAAAIRLPEYAPAGLTDAFQARPVRVSLRDMALNNSDINNDK